MSQAQIFAKSKGMQQKTRYTTRKGSLLMVLACQNISKSFGIDEVLKQVSFHIEEREKAAIVGINGAGKSTLLKIITGEMSADEGQVTIAKNKTLGYLSQQPERSSKNTIFDEMLEVKKEIIETDRKIRELEQNMKHASSEEELNTMLTTYTRLTHEFEQANGYAYKSEITGVLKGLGFSEEDFSKKIDTLSGGQKTRVALGRLLLSKPDIILLDEPTNHLDMDSIAWLETFLMNYPGAVLIVSHDRYFLDKVVTKVVELYGGKGQMYLGNYSEFAKKRTAIRESQLKQYLNQQKEIKHQEEVITKLRSFNREKSIKRAESREKLLNKMEIIEKPEEIHADMRIQLEPSVISGNDVLTVTGLGKSFGDHRLFSDLNFSVFRGEKVALIGNNGTGKTTILKILNKLLRQDSGKIVLGAKVQIGYYDQEHQVLNTNKSIFDEISDTYPNLTQTRIRNVLAAFLFTGDDVFKKIGDLSGGERGRVSLAKLMLSSANFLILDEPTNHLDINSKEILENALSSYTGTVLYVSHDRYFVNKTATRIMELANEEIISYAGNYDYYLNEKAKREARLLAQAEQNPLSSSTVESSSKQDWKKNKEEQAKARKQANALKKCEENIHKTEERIEQLEEEMAKPEIATNVAKLLELNKEKEELDQTLEQLYEEWETLAETVM